VRQSGKRDGKGDSHGRALTARERGWNDSLYEGRQHSRAGREHHEYPGGDARGTPGPKAPHGPGTGQGSGPGPRGGGAGGTGGGKPRKKRRVLRWFCVCLSLLILATAGAGFLYYEHLNGNLSKDILNLGDNKLDKSRPNANGQRPMNILLLGSDSRQSKRNVDLGGAGGDRDRPPLADVQMLLHVSADRSSMSALSIPRDTKATIPRCTDPHSGKVYPPTTEKINTSLQHGGPGCTVATWEEMTGIPVDHFMMIDFAGVVSMADAVGGVPVCVSNNVYDPQSKLRLRKGRSVVHGEQALHWLRTRHGFGDGTDIGRARAQHIYMNSMVRQLKAGTKLSDPGQLRDLAESATEALTVDSGLGTVKKLYDLGNDLKRVPTKRITMATMPWSYAPGGYVVPKPGDAQHTFSLIRKDIALDGKDKKKPESEHRGEPGGPSVPKSRIRVRVQNGTGTSLQSPVPGRAGAISEYLGKRGFDQATADATPKSQADTTIDYAGADQRAGALAVAKAIGLPADAVKHSSGITQITMVIGTDWRSGTAYPKNAGGSGGSGGNRAPADADALNGGDKSACMRVNPSYVW
jgi:LCP family protein required for cell wall assembly